VDRLIQFLNSLIPRRPWMHPNPEAGTIQLPVNSTGTIVDTVTLGGKDREIIVLGGDGAAGEVAGVVNTSPVETEYGLVTRPIQRIDGAELTIATLGISGVFTGAWNDTNADGISFVEASAFADQVSATNGFVIEESDDSADANFTRIVAQATVAVSTLSTIRGAISARYWRVKYTNGATAQGSFKLDATARSSVPPAVDAAGQLQVDVLSVPANQTVDLNQVAGTAVSVNAGNVDAGTQRVVLATDQATVAISAASLPLPSGAATSANQLADGHNVTVDNLVSAPAFVELSDGSAAYIGAKTGQLPAALVGSKLDVVLGAVTAGVTLEVVGDVAQGVTVGGNPVLQGAEARTTNPTAVTDGQAVRLQADDQGRLVTAPFAPRDLVVQGRTVFTTTTEATVLAAAAATFHDLMLAILTNESATKVRVDIRDSTAGTIRFSVELAADGGGAAIPFPATLPQAAVNTPWTAQLSAAVTSVYVTLVAVKRA